MHHVRTLHLAHDDSPSALLACGAGRFCFAGHTGDADPSRRFDELWLGVLPSVR